MDKDKNSFMESFRSLRPEKLSAAILERCREKRDITIKKDKNIKTHSGDSQ